MLLSVNARLSDGHLSSHNSGLEGLTKAIFSTKVCYSGLHFVAISKYFRYTQTFFFSLLHLRQKRKKKNASNNFLQTHPIMHGVRSLITYSIWLGTSLIPRPYLCPLVLIHNTSTVYMVLALHFCVVQAT